MFCLSHGSHRNQAGDGRCHGPKDRDHKHRKSTDSTHTHSLPRFSFKTARSMSQDAVTEITHLRARALFGRPAAAR